MYKTTPKMTNYTGANIDYTDFYTGQIYAKSNYPASYHLKI